MAPEQFDGLRHATQPADVYSLGAMLCEILKQDKPYHGTPIQIGVQKAKAPPTLPPCASQKDQPLWDLCTSTMAPEPSQRPNAKQFATRLHHWLNSTEVVDISELRRKLNQLPTIKRDRIFIDLLLISSNNRATSNPEDRLEAALQKAEQLQLLHILKEAISSQMS